MLYHVVYAALHLGWMLMLVLDNAVWPQLPKRKFTAITIDEYDLIEARKTNLERRHYYELLKLPDSSRVPIPRGTVSRQRAENRRVANKSKRPHHYWSGECQMIYL